MVGPIASAWSRAYHGRSRLRVKIKDEKVEINRDVSSCSRRTHRSAGANPSFCPKLRPLLYPSRILRRPHDSSLEERYPRPDCSAHSDVRRSNLRLLPETKSNHERCRRIRPGLDERRLRKFSRQRLVGLARDKSDQDRFGICLQAYRKRGIRNSPSGAAVCNVAPYFLKTTPPFITNDTFPSTPISCNGSPETAITSAR